MPTNGKVTTQPVSVYDQLDAVILKPPSWIVRSGLGLIGMACTLLISIGWLVQMPDTVTASATITPKQQPVALMAKQSGLVVQLLAKPGQRLRTNDPILYTGDQASLTQLAGATAWATRQDWSTAPPDFDSLGTLATPWLQLRIAWQNLLEYQVYAHPKAIIKLLDTQTRLTTQLEEIDQAQVAIGAKELVLAEQEFLRNKQLYIDKVISLKEYEAAALAFEAAKKQKTGMAAGSTEKRLRMSQLAIEKQRIKTDFAQKCANLQELLGAQAVTFVIATTAWQEEHLIKATTDGTLQLQHDVQRATMLKPDQVIGYLVHDTDSSQSLLAICEVPHTRSGEMRIGNRVRLYLDAFAQEEYGILEGVVVTIQPVATLSVAQPAQMVQQVIVKIPTGCKTSTGKALPFRPNMTARAEIVMRDMRLIERMFGSLFARLRAL
jgi:multidrug efflux pump subunit AcrA (membrane-fusion protein)